MAAKKSPCGRHPGIKVNFPRRLANKFKREAKKSFPLEEYAILLGDILPDGSCNIEDIYMPANRLRGSTEDTVRIDCSWFDEAAELAALQDLCVIGDLHSHCFVDKDYKPYGVPDLIPSGNDWRSSNVINEDLAPSFSIFGICLVKEKDGKMRGRLKFWPVCPRVTSTIT